MPWASRSTSASRTAAAIAGASWARARTCTTTSASWSRRTSPGPAGKPATAARSRRRSTATGRSRSTPRRSRGCGCGSHRRAGAGRGDVQRRDPRHLGRGSVHGRLRLLEDDRQLTSTTTRHERSTQMTRTLNPTKTPDLAAVKQRQQQAWGSGDYHAVAARIAVVADGLVDAADLHAGWRVLDVATGSGNAAIAAARLGCTAVGVDYV